MLETFLTINCSSMNIYRHDVLDAVLMYLVAIWLNFNSIQILLSSLFICDFVSKHYIQIILLGEYKMYEHNTLFPYWMMLFCPKISSVILFFYNFWLVCHLLSSNNTNTIYIKTIISLLDLHMKSGIFSNRSRKLFEIFSAL